MEAFSFLKLLITAVYCLTFATAILNLGSALGPNAKCATKGRASAGSEEANGASFNVDTESAICKSIISDHRLIELPDVTFRKCECIFVSRDGETLNKTESVTLEPGVPLRRNFVASTVAQLLAFLPPPHSHSSRTRTLHRPRVHSQRNPRFN